MRKLHILTEQAVANICKSHIAYVKISDCDDMSAEFPVILE